MPNRVNILNCQQIWRLNGRYEAGEWKVSVGYLFDLETVASADFPIRANNAPVHEVLSEMDNGLRLGP
jgi:hypothetical protein